MQKKSEKQSFAPDTLFQVKEMGKRIKFILKLENLYLNRDDSNGYTTGKITDENPFFTLRFNDPSKTNHISNLLVAKYNYCTEVSECGLELLVSNKPILDPSDIEIDGKIQKETKSNFDNFDHDLDEDPKLKILRTRYKKIIGAIRYHFPMSYGFNENSSNGYRATRIKNPDDNSFFIQLTTQDLADNISHFLFNNGYKVIRENPNTIKVFIEDVPEESEIIKNLPSDEFTGEQLSKIWDMLNTNGLVLLDVNNQYSVLDLFNGKGLPHINKDEFIKIIENQ